MEALNSLHSLILLIFFLFSLNLESQVFASPVLSENEVVVLKKIAGRIGKKDWDFSVDPCSGEKNWSMDDGSAASGIDCDCHFEGNSTCHIIRMSLKSQNISGELPAEFGELVYLEFLDLSRNVFNGSIPTAWSTLSLLDLELMGNRLSGPFPQVIAQMKTLQNLSIEGNRFSGPIPPEIGTLVRLERFLMDSNQFTGELPVTLARLTNLIDLRISDNKFSGKVPDFIGNFTRLEKLQIQGSSLDGPIPSAISNLTNLVDLRITDLGGNWSAFPLLSGMESLKTLILRNCSIHGTIPSYLGSMTTLKILDLSFNKLTGGIPATFAELKKVDFIYLTENALTGVIPSWVLSRNKNLDISRNSFSIGKSGPTECLVGSVNLVESYGADADKLTTVQPCLKRNFPCDASTYKSSLHINCGGREKLINGTKYEADMEERGASMFYFDPDQDWAFSSTGNFMDNNEDSDTYIARNTSKLSMPNAELYEEARLSPLSLTYYGLCMFIGQYTVELHFAETVFHDDKTLSSLGKRIFNVFVQGEMVLEDFNIEKAAGGAGKAVKMSFNASVTDRTLKIQFYWAGKGTTGIPNRGFYGPLISAISVRPNFVPPQDHTGLRKVIKVVIGLSVLVFGLIFLALAIWWRKRCIKRNAVYKDLIAHDLPTGLFQLRQLKAATKNFDPANKIGEGGFGPVYKGVLSDGTIIAVKQLSARSKQGNREFVNEIGTISAVQHPNLVKLYGCCIEANQLLLVYEYMENNSLSRALFGTDPHSEIHLDWPTRCKICLDIARGLAYLHEESRLKIVHRDIKASNVLLDENLNAKISDFGLAKLYEEDKTHISTIIAGTVGYMAPEYAMRGHLSEKADVYSFGVVALEIVTGKSNTSYRPKEDFVYLLDWACVLQERGNLLELVDLKLESDYSEEEAVLLLNVALLCTNASPSLRPTMSKVVSLLELRTPIQPMLTLLNFSDSSRNGVRRNFWEIAAEASLMNSLANTSVPLFDSEYHFSVS